MQQAAMFEDEIVVNGTEPTDEDEVHLGHPIQGEHDSFVASPSVPVDPEDVAQERQAWNNNWNDATVTTHASANLPPTRELTESAIVAHLVESDHLSYNPDDVQPSLRRSGPPYHGARRALVPPVIYVGNGAKSRTLDDFTNRTGIFYGRKSLLFILVIFSLLLIIIVALVIALIVATTRGSDGKSETELQGSAFGGGGRPTPELPTAPTTMMMPTLGGPSAPEYPSAMAPSVSSMAPFDDVTLLPTELTQPFEVPVAPIQAPAQGPEATQVAPVPAAAPTPLPIPRATPTPTIAQTPRPTGEGPSPTAPVILDELIDYLSSISFDGGQALSDPSTPQSRALDWLAAEPNVKSYSNRKRTQRYILATLYFSTNGDGWANKEKWLSENSECNWYKTHSRRNGACNQVGLLDNIDLRGNNLDGEIPPELGLLSDSLIYLYLSENAISGPLPSQLSKLTTLQRLQLKDNSLTGTLPTYFGVMTSLRVLGVGRNQLRGQLPEALSALHDLVSLGLERNRFSGFIPSEYGLMESLQTVAMDYNENLQGRIPTQIANWSRLNSFHLDYTSLTGTIPPELCSFAQTIRVDCEEVECDCCEGCTSQTAPPET